MNLSITSTFRPFTYDEMVKPLVQYKEAYDKVEQDYSDLVAQTEMWKDIATQENSPEAYAMYHRYSSDLNSIVSDFSRGMTLSNRSALMGMKRRYAQDIVPIAQADAALKEANDFRAKMGPDAIFEVGQYDSLDQFLHGKKANNRYQSREALTKKAAAMTEAAMAEAMKDPEFKKVMGDQFWQITQHSGGSYEELMEAMKLGMMDNPLAQNRFSQIRQEVARKAGIQNYDMYGQQAIMDAIDLGLYAGLDKPVTQFQANQAYLNPLQQEQLRQMKMARSSGGRGRGGTGRTGSTNSESSKTGADDGSDRSEENTYVANNIVLEDIDGVGYGVDDKTGGYQTSWEDLAKYPNLKKIADAHIQQSDPRQYEFYTWKSSETGRNRIKIIRKQSYTKPGPRNPALDRDPSEEYMKDRKQQK